MSIKTACPCGNIQIEWNICAQSLQARRCACEYCSLQGGEYVSVPGSTINCKIIDLSGCNIIRQGHGTADFHECTNCGLVIVTSEIEGELFGVINAKVLDIGKYALGSLIDNHSNETVLDRLARRKINWCRVEID